MSVIVCGDSTGGATTFANFIEKFVQGEVVNTIFTSIQREQLADASVLILVSDGTGSSIQFPFEDEVIERLEERSLNMMVFEYCEYLSSLGSLTKLCTQFPLKRSTGSVDTITYTKTTDYEDTEGVLDGVSFPFSFNCARSQCSVRDATKFQAIISSSTLPEVAVSNDFHIVHFACAPTYQTSTYFTNFSGSPMAKVVQNFLERFVSGGALLKVSPVDKDAGNIFSDMEKAFNDPTWSDITFTTSDRQTVLASKWLLCLRSSFFRNMFQSEMIESSQTVIEVDDPAATFLPLIKYIYTDSVSFKDYSYKELVEILEIADKYMLVGMRRLCEKYLCNHINEDNIFDLLLNQKIVYSNLRSRAIRYFLSHKKKLMKTEQAAELLNYPELLFELLESA